MAGYGKGGKKGGGMKGHKGKGGKKMASPSQYIGSKKGK